MLKIFDHIIEKGEKKTIKVQVASFPDGTPISLTLGVINGKKDGPRIGMLGVQHGDEYSGMEVINKTIDSINPEDLSGSLVTVPVSNPLAFNTANRITPPNVGYENLNMNRVWPGNHEGLVMERIVAQLWDHLVKESDIILDMHEGGKAFMAKYIHARGTEETDRIVGAKNKRLYTAFGQGVHVLGGVRTRSHMIGSLSIQTGLLDIPCIGIEVGGGGRLWNDLVAISVQGVRNILIDQGMIQDEPVGQEMKQHVAPISSWPKTSQGGFMYNTCELGSVVEKGTRLGILKDVAGNVIVEVYAPYKSVIFDTRFLPTIYPGDWTFHCGKIG